MEKHWSVSVNIGANNILNIGDNYLSGWDDVMDYADTVQGCAEHLLSFIGRESETTTELRAEVLRLTALCDGYRGEVERSKIQAEDAERRTFRYGEEAKILEDRAEKAETDAANYQFLYEKSCKREKELAADMKLALSALTRARAEGMEESAKIAVEMADIYGQDDNGYISAQDIAAAIRTRAARGDQ